MHRIGKSSLIVLTSALTFISTVTQAAETVRLLSGGPASVKRFDTIKTQAEKEIGVKIEVNITPFDLAFKALTEDLVEGFFSPPYAIAVAGAEKRGAAKQNQDDYRVLQLFSYNLLYVVHADNPVKALSEEQISGILSGKIKNWKEIGGNDTPIHVVLPKNYLQSVKTVLKHYIKADTCPIAEYIPTQEGLWKSMQKNPGEIGFAVTDDGKATFKPRFVPTEARFELYFIIKKKARAEVQKLYDFLEKNKKAFQE